MTGSLLLSDHIGVMATMDLDCSVSYSIPTMALTLVISALAS